VRASCAASLSPHRGDLPHDTDVGGCWPGHGKVGIVARTLGLGFVWSCVFLAVAVDVFVPF